MIRVRVDVEVRVRVSNTQYDNTRGAWLTQEGCTITERKEGSLEKQLFHLDNFIWHKMIND